jgi:predicted adenylyl cyclase CyaB
MQENKKLDPHTEFESKYRIDADKLYEFKSIIGDLTDLKEFIYVEGPDVYWTKGEAEFLRYRKAAHEAESGKAWLTMKAKQKGASNNIIRKEVNWRVDTTPFETIREGAELLGFTYNFKIYKICHIYRFKDATLVFYTVKEDASISHFIEIEVDEETIGNYTEEEAWGVIKKYEAVLSPLGIKPQNRLRKSLFEMYVKGR